MDRLNAEAFSYSPITSIPSTTLNSPFISPPNLSNIPAINPFDDLEGKEIKQPAPKKSHARKQPPGHIPRPRNAFIIFRCDFVHKKKVPESVESDHRNISRIVGEIWRKMTDKEKLPWLDLAEKEKQRHLREHPGYKYTPASSGSVLGAAGSSTLGARKRKGRELVGAQRSAAVRTQSPMPTSFPKRRTSSCPPPGSVPVSLTADDPEYVPQYALPTTSQDDSGRRASRVTMYHSAPLHPHASNVYTINDQLFTFPNSFGERGPPLMSEAFGIIAPPVGQRSWDDYLEPYPLATNDEHHAAVDFQFQQYSRADLGLENYDIQSNFPYHISTPSIKTESPPSPRFGNPFQSSNASSPASSNSFEHTSPYDSPNHASPSDHSWVPPSYNYDDYREYIVDPDVQFSSKVEENESRPYLSPDQSIPSQDISGELEFDYEIGNMFPRLSIDESGLASMAEASGHR